MQASNAPNKSAVPFAESGTKNAIPVASQIGVTPGAASFTDGFPPLTMTPLAAGGVPPYGADFNGILNFLSDATRWAQAGGGYVYDAAFAVAVGGYPKGALLARADGSGYWLNAVDNNLTDPDAGGANWKNLVSGALLRTTVYRINAGVQEVSIDGGSFITTGATTFTNLSSATKTSVLVIGGGGGGGGTEANGAGARSAGAGGSAGGYGESMLAAGFSGVPVTVGAGGAAGLATGPGVGGTGNSTSFGAFLSANGGSGGAKGLTTTAFPLLVFSSPGGTAPLGNIVNARGGLGGWGIVMSATQGISGAGGPSFLGQGGGVTTSTSGDGPTTAGAGGGGAAAAPSSGGFAGGAGAAGIVIIKEYS